MRLADKDAIQGRALKLVRKKSLKIVIISIL